MAVDTHVRAFFSTRRKLGQVFVTSLQFDQIRQVAGRYDLHATPRIDLDVGNLRDAAAERQAPVAVLVCEYLDRLCKDLEHHFGMLCDGGNRLLFTCEPQAQLVREQYELKMFVWCHACLVEPKEPPAVVPVSVPEARRIVQEADDAGERAGSPNYFR